MNCVSCKTHCQLNILVHLPLHIGPPWYILYVHYCCNDVGCVVWVCDGFIISIVVLVSLGILIKAKGGMWQRVNKARILGCTHNWA